MPTGKPTDPKLRAEIVRKIRDEGLSVSKASAQYNISSKSIYTWLRDGGNILPAFWPSASLDITAGR